jgi:UDP-N-acetyl-D-mannosaminuronate dehydrogenase
MPKYFADLLLAEFPEENQCKINCLILGVTYRAGVRETAFSGALALKEYLEEKNVNVFFSDAMYSEKELDDMSLKPYFEDSKIDCLVIHTPHPEYSKLNLTSFLNLKVIIDGHSNYPELSKIPGTKYIGFN